MRRAQFLRAGTAALFGGVTGAILTGSPRSATATAAAIPNPPVLDQSGRRLRFYDDLIRGRAVLLNVFFTACGDTCPLVTQNLREVQDLLGERMGRDRPPGLDRQGGDIAGGHGLRQLGAGASRPGGPIPGSVGTNDVQSE